MDLRTFIFTARTTITHVAKEVGVTHCHMGMIVNGKTKPSKRLALDIERYTKGIVSAEEMLAPWAKEDFTQKFIDENAKIA